MKTGPRPSELQRNLRTILTKSWTRRPMRLKRSGRREATICENACKREGGRDCKGSIPCVLNRMTLCSLLKPNLQVGTCQLLRSVWDAGLYNVVLNSAWHVPSPFEQICQDVRENSASTRLNKTKLSYPDEKARSVNKLPTIPKCWEFHRTVWMK